MHKSARLNLFKDKLILTNDHAITCILQIAMAKASDKEGKTQITAKSAMYKATNKWPSGERNVKESRTLSMAAQQPITPRPMQCRRGTCFLDLPAEIRNVIYRDALVFNGITPLIMRNAWSIRAQNRTRLPCSYWEEDWKGGIDRNTEMYLKVDVMKYDSNGWFYSYLDSMKYRTVTLPRVLSLLSTCRQIYKEARPIFWGANVFVLRNEYDQAFFVRWLNQERRNLIRKLGVRVIGHQSRSSDEWTCRRISWSQHQSTSMSVLGEQTHYPALLRMLRGLPVEFKKESDISTPISKVKTFNITPRNAEGKTIRTGLSLHSPLDGNPRPGSIYDRSLTGPLADYEAGKPTSIDILGDSIRRCKAKTDLGWRFVFERREGPCYKRQFPYVPYENVSDNCYLWVEKVEHPAATPSRH